MHSIKDIALFVDGSSNHEAVLDAASQFAQTHGAHVTGFYVVSPPPDYSGVTSIGGIIPQEIVDRYYKGAHDHADDMGAAFEQAMADRDVHATWQVDEGHTVDLIPRMFRYADVGIVGQPKPDFIEARRPLINTILRASGRPLIIIPHIGAHDTIGKRVIIGWNNSKEAARAIHDAMPILRQAESVEILDIAEHSDRKTLGSSVPMTQHLARHGVTATATSLAKTDIGVGDVILNRVSDIGADLIVAGAWGHTRAAEYIFGGATRSFIEHTTVPVLLSH